MKCSQFDRSITHQLYGGDWENRLKQEILLGIGGILTLKKLGIKKDIYHCNEGHAALINVQRICDYVAEGLTYHQAIELVRASSLYTVHTPVPAGHDYFDEGLFGKYMGGYPSRMGISWDDLMDLGRNNPGDKGERFCMSVFACNTSREVVACELAARKGFPGDVASIWKGYFPEKAMWASLPTVYTSPLGALWSGNISMLRILMRTSSTTSPTPRFGRLSITCPTKKSGRRAW